jgi:integrase
MAGGIGRRCRCRDGNGKDLGAKCPKLSQRRHGTWYVQQELASDPSGPRKIFRRQGFATKDEAQDELDKVRELVRLAGDDEADLRTITEMLMALDRNEDLPDPDTVRGRLKAGVALNPKQSLGEWLDHWIDQREKRLRLGIGRKNTLVSYKSHVRLYLKPLAGHLRRDRITIDDLIELFNKISDNNDAILAANDDRRATIIEMKAVSSRARKRALRERLAAMEPFQRPVGLASQARILATLRVSLNEAIQQQLQTFNPAMYFSIGAEAPTPIVWTPERVERWRRTGRRPGSVMVWTPQQVGIFFDYVAEHDPDYEAMWHVMIKRGTRRGETAGLGWTETHRDLAKIEIVGQLVEIEGVVEEGAPKSRAGKRTVPVDSECVELLDRLWKRQQSRRLALGDAWVDSGRTFTYDDGSALRPSWIGDRFAKLSAAAGLPPVRLHDLRHIAATLMRIAGMDMKDVQVILGHSNLSTTGDIYTSVLPELLANSADAVQDVVPRKRRSVAQVGESTDHPGPASGALSGAPPKRRITRGSPTRSTLVVEGAVVTTEK